LQPEAFTQAASLISAKWQLGSLIHPATVEPGTFGFTNPPFGGYPHYCEICEVFYPQEAD